jgi:hypothetical protein
MSERMVALVTLDAAPVSWLMHIQASGEAGLASGTILWDAHCHRYSAFRLSS